MTAAAEVFAASGYAGSSLDDVASAAGFSKGAVYSNFADKQELLLSLMREQIERRIEAVREVTEGDRSAAEVSARAGDALAAISERQPDWHLLFIEFWIHAVRNPAIQRELAQRRQPMRTLIAGFIEEQAERFDAALPLPSADLATIVLALSNGLVIEHLADPDEVGADLFGPALELVLGGIAASSA